MVSGFARQALLVTALLLAVTSTVMSAHAKPNDAIPDAKERQADLLKRATRAVDVHVLPAFKNLEQTTNTLTNAIEYHCDAQDIGSLKTVEQAFEGAVLAWAAAEHLRFGPLRDAGRASHIHFWPDPRGVTSRQMRRVFHEHKPERLKPDVLKDQSVAVLGFGALEYFVLYEKRRFQNASPERTEDYECLYARGVARLVEQEAKFIHTEWIKPNGWRDRILNPTSEQDFFRSAEESVGQLVKSLVLGLQLVRSQKIVPLYELVIGNKKRAKLPFQRLGLADEYVRASLISLQQLNEALSLTDYARGRTAWVKRWTAQGFDALRRRSEGFRVPDSKRLTPEDFKLSDLRQMRFYTNGLRQVIARQTAPSAGLTIGFNELDGD